MSHRLPLVSPGALEGCAVLAAALLLSAGLVAADPADGPPSAAQDDEVLARLGETTITMADVRELAGTELGSLEFQYRRQRHQVVEAALQQLLRQELLGREAARRGITPDALLRQELGEPPAVTEEQVEAWYAANRARLEGRSLEQLRPAIRQFLTEQARERALEELVERLGAEHGLTMHLEPFRANLDNAGAPARGPADAPVTLVEFSDFECPYCGGFVDTLERVRDTYGDRVRLVYRHFPLRQIHPNAQKAAEAAACAADQDSFWEMHDLLFDEQDSLAVPDLVAKAERLGLDVPAFEECLSSDRHADLVQADLEAGQQLGVTGTPALFVNGRPVEGGAVPYERVAEIVGEELERSTE